VIDAELAEDRQQRGTERVEASCESQTSNTLISPSLSSATW
jgi:hypothetical protein